MKRFLTATCLAAACAVGLAAQSGTTGTTGTSSTTMQNPQGGRGGPRTMTGCLRAGDTAGTYMLTDIQMAGAGGTTAGSTSGTSTTAGSTSGTSSATSGQGMRGQMPTSLMLNAGSDVDLKAHVGHKIEVTGTMAGGGRRGGDTSTTGGGTSTTGGSTSSGSTSGSSTAASTTGQGGQRGGRSLTVTSVRMISESCS